MTIEKKPLYTPADLNGFDVDRRVAFVFVFENRVHF